MLELGQRVEFLAGRHKGKQGVIVEIDRYYLSPYIVAVDGQPDGELGFTMCPENFLKPIGGLKRNRHTSKHLRASRERVILCKTQGDTTLYILRHKGRRLPCIISVFSTQENANMSARFTTKNVGRYFKILNSSK